MARLIALILGGVVLLLYVPLFLPAETAADVEKVWTEVIPMDLYVKLKLYGAGVAAGIALLLFAVRGRD